MNRETTIIRTFQILLVVLLLAGCSKARHRIVQTSCWFPEVRTATSNDVARFTAIVASLRSGKVALYERKDGEAGPATNVLSGTKLALPTPPKAVFTPFAISDRAREAIFTSMMGAQPLVEKNWGRRDRNFILHLGAGRPYGAVLPLELLENDGVVAYLNEFKDFPERVDIYFSVPGFGQIVSNIVAEQSNLK